MTTDMECGSSAFSKVALPSSPFIEPMFYCEELLLDRLHLHPHSDTHLCTTTFLKTSTKLSCTSVQTAFSPNMQAFSPDIWACTA